MSVHHPYTESLLEPQYLKPSTETWKKLCILNIHQIVGRISFYKEARQAKGEAAPNPICNLNISLPADISPDHTFTDKDLLAIQVHVIWFKETL